MERDGGVADRAGAERAGFVDARDELFEARERRGRHRAELAAELQVGNDLYEDEAIQRGMVERGLPERAHARFDEIPGHVFGARHRVDRIAQHLEQARRERFEQAVLRPEDAVDRPRRRADCVRDGAYRRRVRAVGVDESLGRGQQGDPGRIVVLLRSAHG